MDVAQPTLAEQLAVPLVMLICTGILTLIGFLLSRQLSAMDRRDDKHDEDLEDLKTDMVVQKFQMSQVRKALGLSDSPSPWVLKKNQGESSA